MRKLAFTLSEVLITLGIIGVVAALTLPALIKNYQMKALNSQFKRTYTTLSNAIVKARADLGYEPVCSYGFKSNGAPSDTNCVEMHNQMLANLDIVKRCSSKALQNGCIAPIKGLDTVKMANDPNLSNEDAQAQTAGMSSFREHNIHNVNPAYILKDGSMLMLFYTNKKFPFYLVDVNGLKNPNKWGYDIYIFHIYKNRLQCYSATPYEKGGYACNTMLLK